MPARHSVFYEPKLRRWWIQHKGKHYVISCRQLGVVQTKEGSYQAANAWWSAKKREIDRLVPPVRGSLYPPYHAHEDEIIRATQA